MKVSAATVRHELDAPTMWGATRICFPYGGSAAWRFPMRYLAWRDPDDRRGEPRVRRWKATA